MPDPAPLTYSVLLARRCEDSALAHALAKVRKEPMADAARRARVSCGLLETGMSEADAKARAAALAEAGAAAFAVPDNLVEEPPAAAELARLSPSPEGLRWQARGGAVEASAAWKRVKLIAATAFKRTHSKTVKTLEGPDLGRRALSIGLSLATGLPPSLTGGGPKREVEKTVSTSELVEYADVVLDGPGERLRVDAQDFDFSGLGPLKAYDAPTNFKRLLMELVRLAPQAARNAGADVIVAGRPLLEIRRDDLAQLEREERWLLTLLALGKL